MEAGLRYRLDAGARRIDGGLVLVGGSPLRILRLTSRGAALVARLAAGEPAGAISASEAELLNRLVAGGVLHPRPAPRAARSDEVSVVIPAYDRPDALATTLAGLAATAPGVPIIVVDDGGPEPERTAALAAGHGATLLRHPVNRGPAAARNTGLAAVTGPVVAFLDAGCEPLAGWLEALLAVLDLDSVVLVAPRIVAAPGVGQSAVARYEQARSSLDLGAEPAPVRPRSRVPYVPSACLMGLAEELRQAGGFADELRVGEDVDLVWRLVEAGRGVRYEPAAEVGHDHRTRLGPFLRRRFAYGTSAAPLHQRHPGAVAPLAVSGWSAAAWAALAAGCPLGAAGLVAGTTGALARRLGALEHPVLEAWRLAGTGNLLAGRAVADAVVRAWWPLSLGAALVSRRARWAAFAAATLPALLDWRRRRPKLDPTRWTALRLADDLAYGAGLWWGCLREHTTGPLRPDLASWPGRRAAVASATGAP